MLRILLVTTRSYYRPTVTNFHYGVLALGSYVKRNSNHYIELLDGSIYDYSTYLDILIKKARLIDIVGFSIMTPQIGDVYRSILHLKNNGIKPIIVVGGHHVTLYPEQTIQSEFIDFAVIGDGEKSFLSLCNALDSRERTDNIQGVITKWNITEILKNPIELLNYDELYDSDYDLIDPKMQEVLHRQFFLLTGRGCMFKCAFCYNSAIGNKFKWRGKAASIIIDEIDEFYRKYKFKNIYFRDEYFFSDRDRVIEILLGLAQRDYPFTWTSTCRTSDFRKKIDKEVINLLVESKCEELKFGAESGSDRCLKFLNKGITVDDTIRAAQICAANKIRGSFSFLSGYPTETHDERIQTAKLITKIKEISKKHIILGPFAYYIYPGGKLYEMIVAKKEWNIDFPKSFEEWAMSKYGNMFESQSEPEKFAWLDEPDFVKYFWYIIFFRYLSDHLKGFSLKKAIFIRFLLSSWIISTKIRCNFLYFNNLYEYKLYELLDLGRRFIKKFIMHWVLKWKR